MNILFLSELFYPHGGGAELATFLYAKLLNESGFDVTVVTNKFEGEPDVSRTGNLVVYRLPLFRNLRNVKYSILKRIDILFSSFMKERLKLANFVYVPRFWFSSIPIAKAFGKPVLVHLHDYIPICPLSNLFDLSRKTFCDRTICSVRCVYAFERAGSGSLLRTIGSTLLNPSFGIYISRIIRLADAVICVSKAQKRLILREHPDWNPKFHVIYNPLPRVSKKTIKGEDFGYFGGPSYIKGFHLLLRSAAHLVNFKHEPMKIHATKFPSVDKVLNRKLRHLGVIPYEKLNSERFAELNDRIGAIIVPSIWAEPLPYVVTEALLSGKLVIASRVGGIPEQTEGCKGAFLFDAGNHVQLAEKMLYVKNLGKEALYDLGISNKQSVMNRFRNNEIVAHFVDLLERVEN